MSQLTLDCYCLGCYMEVTTNVLLQRMDCYTILTGLLHLVISPFGYYLAFVLNSPFRLTMLATVLCVVGFVLVNSVMCCWLCSGLLFCTYNLV